MHVLTVPTAHSRFINLYGQANGARLARNQSTQSEDDSDIPICTWIRLTFTILLWKPYKELKELKSLWVDNIVYTEHGRMFITTHIQEWRSVSLLVCPRYPHRRAKTSLNLSVAVFYPSSVGFGLFCS